MVSDGQASAKHIFLSTDSSSVLKCGLLGTISAVVVQPSGFYWVQLVYVVEYRVL